MKIVEVGHNRIVPIGRTRLPEVSDDDNRLAELQGKMTNPLYDVLVGSVLVIAWGGP